MKVLIVARLDPILTDSLQENGHTVDVELELNQEELEEKIADYHGLVVRSSFQMNKTLIDKASQLRFIARAGAGMEHIDIDYASSKGIMCFNSPEGNAAAVAEHVIGMMLSILHNIRRSDAEMRHLVWNREANRGQELSYKTVGILGSGNTGSEVINKLSGFGCRVIAHDLNASKIDTKLAESVSLEELQSLSDIISVHIPMNAKNAHFIDDSFINKCRKPILLINASRGGVLKTTDLLKGLDSGKLVGLGMDVFENEKLDTYSEAEKIQFQNLIKRENVLLTPHIAGWSIESEYKIADYLVKKILNLS